MKPPKLALAPPSSELALLTQSQLDEALEYSRKSPRQRVILPLHRSESDALQRMFNAIQPASYVRPHRHLHPPKAEAWIVLRGAALFVTFRDDGAIDQHVVLRAAGDPFGVDLVPGRYHTVLALAADTVVYEVKTGPYNASDDKEFAPFAPAEGSADAAGYLARLRADCCSQNT